MKTLLQYHRNVKRFYIKAREELRLRCENFEQETEKMRGRLDDLLSAAEQTRSLKVIELIIKKM